MKQNITQRGISLFNSILAAFLFVFISVVATSCGQTEDYAKGNKPSSNDGDTFFSFDADNSLKHGDWDIADGLGKVSHTLQGFIIHSKKVNNELTEVGRDELSEALPMTIKYTAKYEGTNLQAVKYLSQETSAATEKGSKPNNKMTNKTFNKTTTLKFEGFNDVKLEVEYLVAYLGQDAGHYCDYLKSEVTSIKADTLPEIIKKEDGDYKREITTITVKPFFVDMPAKTPCNKNVVDLILTRQNDFRVNIQPGEKIYVGKTVIEGSGNYYPLPNGNFHSEIKYLKTFTQDGKTITEEATFSGEARIIWNIPGGNLFTLKSIDFGNPLITPDFTDDKEYTVKSPNLKALVRHYTFDATWEMGYSKKITCAVDRLYAVDEHDVYELPTGESTLGYAGYIPGQATETTEYSTYNDGVLKFVGNHASKKDYPLEVGQVFQVKKDRKFIGYEFPKTFDPITGKSKIEVYEIWEGEPKKLTDTYETTMTQRKHGEPESRFYGSSLSFTSGLTKTVSEADYTAEANGVMATIETTTWAARLSLGTSSAYYERSKKHVMHGNKKVEFQGYPAPTAAEFGSVTLTNTNDNFVEGDDTYTRRSYNVSFTIDGETIINKVNVDALQPKTPTVDPEFGYLDWAKTVQFGRVSICWDVVNGKLTPRVSVSVITSVGVLNSIDKVKYFYKMDTNTISYPLSACLKVGVGNKFIPGSAEIKKGTSTDNTVWSYLGIDGTSPTSVNNADVVKLGVKEVNPFISAPEDGTQTFVNKNGRVIVKYKGETIFDEVFPVKPETVK